MSVRTTAAENLDQIRESLHRIRHELLNWVYSNDKEMLGKGEYSEEYVAKVEEAVKLVYQAKKLLD